MHSYHSFLLNAGNNSFLSLFVPWHSSHSVESCFSFHEFVGFLLLKSSFNPCWYDRRQGCFQFSYICWNLLCDLVCGKFWRLFCEVLRSMCILLCLGEMFVIRSIWFIMSVSSVISLFSFCLNHLSIDENGIVKSPTINVWESMFD